MKTDSNYRTDSIIDNSNKLEIVSHNISFNARRAQSAKSLSSRSKTIRPQSGITTRPQSGYVVSNHSVSKNRHIFESK